MKRDKEKILIVDDEGDIALILKLQLEDAGYVTTRARDGIEAIECLDKEEFSLMLLDVKMPRMGGLQVLEAAQRLHKDVAVVMMTAHGSEHIAVEAMKQGATDYVAKPFSAEDLLKRVERAIQFNRTRLENTRLQQEVDVERKKLNSILQGMADLLVAVDDQGRIITLNRQAEEQLGMRSEEAMGKTAQDVIKKAGGDTPLPCLVAINTQSACLAVEYQLIDRNSQAIPVLSSANPLFDTSGKLIGGVEIIRDISVLKALEHEREDFVSMLSHDLKSPITAVVGSVDLVRAGTLGPVNEEQREYLDSAMESCSEMVEMINTLLDVHKFEAGKMRLTFRQEDPRSLILRAVASYRAVAERNRIKLFGTCADHLPHLSLDREHFARLLGNLLSNAMKFTPEGGEIEVAAFTSVMNPDMVRRIPAGLYESGRPANNGKFLQLTVRDTGTGISPDSLTIIFDRFEQAKNRRLGKTNGTGLGLAYCRKVMDAHGGYIWAESKPDAGSIFTLLFPLETTSSH